MQHISGDPADLMKFIFKYFGDTVEWVLYKNGTIISLNKLLREDHNCLVKRSNDYISKVIDEGRNFIDHDSIPLDPIEIIFFDREDIAGIIDVKSETPTIEQFIDNLKLDSVGKIIVATSLD